MRLLPLLSIAWRESRFGRRRLFLFLSAISLGVAALVAVQGFAANLQQEVRQQARAMLGADLSLSSREPFGTRSEAILDSLSTNGTGVARVTSFASMAFLPRNGESRLVQIRAPEPGFPFYGVIETEPTGRWESLQQGKHAIVDPALLLALDAQLGDSIAIGANRFEIIAALERIPGDLEIASTFAPRVFIPAHALAETGLLGFGARVDHEAFVRISDPLLAEAFAERYRAAWRGERVRLRTVQDQQERMEAALGSLAGFLGLVGIFAILLGGIGVASSMKAYMARKQEAIAVLRCIGATAGQVLVIYLAQAALMGLLGAALGVALGTAVQRLLPELFSGLLPVDVQVRIDRGAVVTGMAVGVWTALGFALLPILESRAVPPLNALRRRVERVGHARSDALQWSAWGLIATTVFLLITAHSGALLHGAIISAAVGGALLLLALLGRATIGAVRRIPRTAFFYPIRQGVANLHRPGNQTITVIVALGFGIFLLATLLLTQATVLRPLFSDNEEQGNLLLFDLTPDQLPAAERIVSAHAGEVVERAALISMRIAAIRGVEVGRWTGEEETAAEIEEGERPAGWALRREYRSTYRDTLAGTEALAAGRWWGPGRASAESPYEVSLERELASELGVALGDRIDWDVQGVRVPTRVTSLRSVDWAQLQPNFFAIFEPAALQRAPQSWVLLTRAEAAADRAMIQHEVVRSHPNVAVVDLTLMQAALDEVVGRVSFVIRFLASFSIATGFIVLLGAVATGRLQRIRESVLLRTLGATRGQIASILLVEYALLGALSALAGSILSIMAAWGIAHFLFSLPFAVEARPLLALGCGIILLSALIGISASSEVFRATPMQAIREE